MPLGGNSNLILPGPTQMMAMIINKSTRTSVELMTILIHNPGILSTCILIGSSNSLIEYISSVPDTRSPSLPSTMIVDKSTLVVQINYRIGVDETDTTSTPAATVATRSESLDSCSIRSSMVGDGGERINEVQEFADSRKALVPKTHTLT